MPGIDGAVCPACGKHITWRQLTWGTEEYAFRCKKCDARLKKWTGAFPILIIGGLAGIVALHFFVEGPYSDWAKLGLPCVLAVVGYFTTRVSFAGDEIQDEPKDEPPSSPPPLNPTFRGMSGPPPKRED